MLQSRIFYFTFHALFHYRSKTHARSCTTPYGLFAAAVKFRFLYGLNFLHLRSKAARFLTRIPGFTKVSNTPNCEFTWGLLRVATRIVRFYFYLRLLWRDDNEILCANVTRRRDERAVCGWLCSAVFWVLLCGVRLQYVLVYSGRRELQNGHFAQLCSVLLSAYPECYSNFALTASNREMARLKHFSPFWFLLAP